MGEDLVGQDVFGDDYLWFYDEPLERRSDGEVELILRLLGLPSGASVLDAPCGQGRIANRLARGGVHVVGLDRSERLLQIARERASEAGVSVEYVEGDLRSLPFDGRFDAVVNWFSSFGYFDDEGNRQVLDGFRRALKPGGVLLMEQASRDFLVANLPPGGQAVWLTERGDDLMIDKVTFDAAAGRSDTERIVVRDGQVKRTRFSLAQPSVSELAGMLRDAGFSEVEALDAMGRPFEVGSRRLVLLARGASTSAKA